MAFDRANWSPIGGQSKRGKAPQMWSYTTTDAKTVVDGAGYFNDVSGDVVRGWWYRFSCFVSWFYVL